MQNPSYTIRAWEKNDYVSLAKYANNINVWNNVRDIFPYPYREEDAKLYIHSASSKPFVEDMAIDIEGEAVGGLGFVPKTDVERLNAEIGYWIGEPFWNKGIMTRAVAEFVKYIFANTDIIRLFAPVYEYNPASMKVLEKNGFTKVGIMKQAAIKNNKILDLHYYELLKAFTT
jgi:RimJ/RimL family protein N-acetyltransferase